MDEVLAAEVFHPSGDIGHKLYQHLRRQVLKDKIKVPALTVFWPITLEGTAVCHFPLPAEENVSADPETADSDLLF